MFENLQIFMSRERVKKANSKSNPHKYSILEDKEENKEEEKEDL